MKSKTKPERKKGAAVRVQRMVGPHVRLLTEILQHQIANRGTPAAFYRCYTYDHGKMPAWVRKAEKLVQPNGQMSGVADKQKELND